MNFVDTIKTCYKKYTKFEGRASRSEFWYFWLFNYATYAILIIIALNISFKFFWFLGVFFLVNFIPFIAVTARNGIKLTKKNTSGWFQILPLPFSILDRILERTSQEGLSIIFALIAVGLYIYLIVLWCTKGAKKNNKFGKNIYKKRKKRR